MFREPIEMLPPGFSMTTFFDSMVDRCEVEDQLSISTRSPLVIGTVIGRILGGSAARHVRRDPRDLTLDLYHDSSTSRSTASSRCQGTDAR